MAQLVALLAQFGSDDGPRTKTFELKFVVACCE